MNQITLTVMEIFISLVIESTILAGIFSYLSNRANEKQETKLKEELTKIEQQNKLIFQELAKLIRENKAELISQVKESAAIKNGGVS